MISAASGDACATPFKKGLDDGQGQQLPGQRQEEGKGKGLCQAGAKSGCEEKVSPMIFRKVAFPHGPSPGAEQLTPRPNDLALADKREEVNPRA